MQPHLFLFLFVLIFLRLEKISSAKLDDCLQFVFIKRFFGILLGVLPSNNGFASGVHVLDDQVVKNHLVLRLLDDVLVHTAAGHQPEDLHLLLLSNPVRPGDGLQVILGVEIRIVDDDSVRGLEIYTETASFSREEETEV